mgnify:FL=1
MKKVLFFIILALMLLPNFVLAAEYIQSFDSQITVHEDSSMTVTEKITVNVENLEIKHGIYRDFPTKYKDDKGMNFNVAFEVLEVKLDGGAVQYAVSDWQNGKRIKIGDPNSFVVPGIHVYEIKYQTKYQLGFFSDHDELYWNVTGNGWVFRIEKASAAVFLPVGISASEIRVDGYTGPTGSKAKNFLSQILSSNEIYFETTHALAPEEGLTIVVGWPKGLVQEPSQREVAAQYAKSNRGIIVALVGLIAGCLVLFIGWYRHGRDPAKGTVIPQYEPPQGQSPGLMRNIYMVKYDEIVLTATLINLGVKGYLKITEEKNWFKKVYTI